MPRVAPCRVGKRLRMPLCSQAGGTLAPLFALPGIHRRLVQSRAVGRFFGVSAGIATLRLSFHPAFRLVLLCCLGTSVGAEPRQLYVQPSALVQVVRALHDEPPARHADFAALTLEALTDAYREELVRSAPERGRGGGGEPRLARWRGAMEMEVHRLQRLRLALETTSDVRVRSDRQGQVLLLVAGEPLLVSWPRVSGQADREAELVARFCAFHSCPDTDEAGAPRGVVRAASVRGAWGMSQWDGPGWVSASGVRCAFADLRDRESREARCRALAADLETLAQVLAEVRDEGGRIEWQALRVEDEPGGGPQRVSVNERGDYLLLNLGALARENVDWHAVRRWLERRVGGVQAVETVWTAGH